MTDPTKPPDTEATASPSSGPSFEARMEGFGKEVEDAANRWSHDPNVKQNVTFLGRFWGLLLVGVGVWLFAGVSLGYDLPSLPLRDLWPVALIVLGGAVILRGFGRRT